MATSGTFSRPIIFYPKQHPHGRIVMRSTFRTAWFWLLTLAGLILVTSDHKLIRMLVFITACIQQRLFKEHICETDPIRTSDVVNSIT
jgi:hypothetical protein